jgi:hypothetical protein
LFASLVILYCGVYINLKALSSQREPTKAQQKAQQVKAGIGARQKSPVVLAKSDPPEEQDLAQGKTESGIFSRAEGG